MSSRLASRKLADLRRKVLGERFIASFALQGRASVCGTSALHRWILVTQFSSSEFMYQGPLLVDLRSSLQDDASGIRRRHGGSAMIATKHRAATMVPYVSIWNVSMVPTLFWFPYFNAIRTRVSCVWLVLCPLLLLLTVDGRCVRG